MSRARKKRRLTYQPIMPLDLAITAFLWKWKLSTSLVLFHAVAAGQEKARTFNKRLTKLEERGLIEMNVDYCNRRKLWELTPLGLTQIKSKLPELIDSGIKSASLDHDFACLAFIYGEWAFEKEKKPEIITDQELLRVHEDYKPSWVPDMKTHRADGYLRIPPTSNGATAIAFEAELSVKNCRKYQQAIYFYRRDQKVLRVLWMYRDPYFITQFLRAKAEVRDDTENFHVFVNEEDYLKDGWNANVTNQRSETILKLGELLQRHLGVDPGEIAGNSGMISKISIFHDRKKFVDLKRSYEESK